MKTILSLAAFAAFSLTAVNAQTFDSVKVHFDQAVQVASNQLPAGDYTITMLKSNGEVPLLRFASDHGANVLAFATRTERPSGSLASRTEVLLDKTGEVEQVTRIEIEGTAYDYILPVTHH